MNARCMSGLALAMLIAVFSGLVGAADNNDAVRRTLLKDALAKQLARGLQTDDGLWPQRISFVTRMSDHYADAKLLVEGKRSST